MHFSAFSLLPFLALADVALSICPGSKYGISNVEAGSGFNRWTVYDNSCTKVDSLTLPPRDDPCTTGGIFGCSPASTTFNKYMPKGSTGPTYTCRPDTNSGTCGSSVISVCCH
ncbi:hypothetical protein BDN72DRAFT_881166 [Pluteus cervinus]|uniref:Uncharacterized protein n=1 Tax=Pluteus cervinus TaxID=181527 RepID=A0ACD3AHD1_9AGAR|nr:hypothetical protein BDN72DRAFT_881166 [Pluteus cervinus]